IVRGATFLHANLRFAIEFPSGWDVTNSAAQVVAKEPGEPPLMLLQLVQRPVGRTIEEIALQSMQAAGFRPLNGRRTTINGLDAFVGTYAGTLQNFGRAGIRAAHVVHNRNVLLIAGIAPEQTYQRLEPIFGKSLDSFRPITRGEAESIHPNRIDLYTARSGDTWQAIAERAGKGIVKASPVGIMNGHAVNDQPRAGEGLKIVVAG